MMTPVRFDAVLIASARKNEGISIATGDAKTVLKYMNVDDRHLLCDGNTLELRVQDVRKGWKKSTVKAVRFADVVELAIEVCGSVIRYTMHTTGEEERILALQEFNRDMICLLGLRADCGLATA